MTTHPAVEGGSGRGAALPGGLLGAAGPRGGGRRRAGAGQLGPAEGHVQGRVPVLVLHVDVGALRHQQLQQPLVALRHRQLQRRLVAVVADVDVAAALWVQKRRRDGQDGRKRRTV